MPAVTFRTLVKGEAFDRSTGSLFACYWATARVNGEKIVSPPLLSVEEANGWFASFA